MQFRPPYPQNYMLLIAIEVPIVRSADLRSYTNNNRLSTQVGITTLVNLRSFDQRSSELRPAQLAMTFELSALSFFLRSALSFYL